MVPRVACISDSPVIYLILELLVARTVDLPSLPIIPQPLCSLVEADLFPSFWIPVPVHDMLDFRTIILDHAIDYCFVLTEAVNFEVAIRSESLKNGAVVVSGELRYVDFGDGCSMFVAGEDF